MTLSIKHPGKGRARANKVYVNTKISSDGRSLEGFWLDYDPDDNYALYMLQHVLNASEMVDYYWIFDREGTRMEPTVKDTKQH
jgi:hypothetical protein